MTDIIGTEGDDTLSGLAGPDRIRGLGGNDRIFAGYGDSVDGGAGFDILHISFEEATGGVVADFRLAAGGGTVTIGGATISGVEALEWLEGSEFDDVIAIADNSLERAPIYGRGGNDHITAGRYTGSLFGGDGNDVFQLRDAILDSDHFGEGGNDWMVGGPANDGLFGGDGNDWLRGEGGKDTYSGGPGTDTVDFSHEVGPVVVNLSESVFLSAGDHPAGTRSLSPGEALDSFGNYETLSGIENLRLSGGDDRALGSDGPNLIEGGGGNDWLDGGGGDDRLAGGQGNDTYTIDAGDIVIEAANEGVDEIRTPLADTTVPANVENLTGILDTGQTLRGNALSNVIAGGAGADSMLGGRGDDVYVVGAGDIVVELVAEGTDEVRTALPVYWLAANAERLTGISATGQSLNGNALGNTIVGGPGNDVLNGDSGADRLAGGAGNDRYYIGVGDVVTEAANAGVDEVRTPLADTTAPANVEYLTGMLDTGQTLRGNALNNVIRGGAGADSMLGGLGDDVYLVAAGDIVTELLGEGTDEVRTALAAYTLAANVEKLRGISATGQALNGNALANEIAGGAGDDTLDGGTGADRLAGGSGDDIYLVGTGDSVIEEAGKGVDEVRTGLASYTLAANVERLIGTSATGQALTGNGGANLIFGGAGNDVLNGAGGADQLMGGLGDDVYLAEVFGTVVELAGEGTDEVRTARAAYTLDANIERLTGTSATGQALTGNALANTIVGGAGNDTLDGTSGADTMLGGLGNDVYVFETDDTVVELAGEGSDEVRTAIASYMLGTNLERLTGTSATGQTLIGNALNNVIAGGAGADSMLGGLGDDIYLVLGGDNVVELAGEGNDEVRTALAAYTLGANLERLTGISATGQALTGNALDNTIVGGAGKDTLDGASGADSMLGGLGDDVYVVEADDNVVELAGQGNDEVRTALASYTLAANVERLTGTSATGQWLTGNALANTLVGGVGADVMFGGLGNDVYFVEPGDRVYEYKGQGTDEIRTAQAVYTLGEWIENLTGTSATGQQLYGNSLPNTITGGAGDDILKGAGANSWSGGDLMKGGLGNDVYYVAWNDTVFELAGQGIDEVRTDGAYTLPANVERLIGSSFEDRFLGNDLDNFIDGGYGNDSLWGGAGADWILGGAGNDTLKGGDGADQLYGGGDNDELDGGAGADYLAGGPGDDIYGNPFGPSDSVDADDTIVELAGAGTDTVRTALASYTLGANLERLIGTSSAQTLTGNELANVITGGVGPDILNGAGGDDVFGYVSDGQLTGDRVNGGDGYDTVELQANWVSSDYVFGPGTLTSVERILLAPSHNFEKFTLVLEGGNIAAGNTLLIDGSSQILTVDGRLETAGSLIIYGGRWNDVLNGSAQGDVIRGGEGLDYINGNGGADLLVYINARDSTGQYGFDQLAGFDYRVDKIDLPGSVSGWAAAVSQGRLAVGTFDADLAAALDPALGANQAVLFSPDSGDYAGRLFVVIDANGDGAYRFNQDYLFELVAPVVPIAPVTDFFV